MATIKTQLVDGERRIITKVVNGQRRVSCSCCETECCMYPATKLEQGIFTVADLPDSITVVDSFTTPGEVALYFVAKNEDGSYGEGGFSPQQGQPGAFFLPDEWLINSGQVTPGQGDCLFVEEYFLSPPADFVYTLDNFEDTYSFTTPEGSGTLTRESLCVWRGGGRSLTFVSGDTFVGWTFGGTRKEGTQNTPVGTYGEATIS
jgi:hypothetical protein